jgi:hypothetical protein
MVSLLSRPYEKYHEEVSRIYVWFSNMVHIIKISSKFNNPRMFMTQLCAFQKFIVFVCARARARTLNLSVHACAHMHAHTHTLTCIFSRVHGTTCHVLLPTTTTSHTSHTPYTPLLGVDIFLDIGDFDHHSIHTLGRRHRLLLLLALVVLTSTRTTFLPFDRIQSARSMLSI